MPSPTHLLGGKCCGRIVDWCVHLALWYSSWPGLSCLSCWGLASSKNLPPNLSHPQRNDCDTATKKKGGHHGNAGKSISLSPKWEFKTNQHKKQTCGKLVNCKSEVSQELAQASLARNSAKNVKSTTSGSKNGQETVELKDVEINYDFSWLSIFCVAKKMIQKIICTRQPLAHFEFNNSQSTCEVTNRGTKAASCTPPCSIGNLCSYMCQGLNSSYWGWSSHL